MRTQDSSFLLDYLDQVPSSDWVLGWGYPLCSEGAYLHAYPEEDAKDDNLKVQVRNLSVMQKVEAYVELGADSAFQIAEGRRTKGWRQVKVGQKVREEDHRGMVRENSMPLVGWERVEGFAEVQS